MMVDLRKMMIDPEDVEMRTHKSNGAPLRVVSVDVRKEFRVSTTMVRQDRNNVRQYQEYVNSFYPGWDEDFMTFHD